MNLTRELYVPRELVFDAWTQPEHLAQWYAPPECRMESVVVEPVPGGRFDLCWRDPAGSAFREQGEFEALERPSGFVCTVRNDPAPDGMRRSRLRVTLHDLLGACRIDVDQETVPEGDEQSRRETWERRLDRLESYFSAI